MGMRGRQYERPQGRQVQPKRQFAADDAATFAGAAAGYDFNAAQLFGMCGEQEALKGVQGGLRSLAMQVERSGRGEFSGAKPVPGGLVEAGRVLAGNQGVWSWPGAWSRRCFRLRDSRWSRGHSSGGRQRHVAPCEGGHVADVIGPGGAVVVCEGA